MKDGLESPGVDRSESMNGQIIDDREDTDLCTNMSVDETRDESECSDFDEDNTRCHMANQALRAKLLSSAVKPTSETNSKLRVSVFDHRIIPKKFISGRILDNLSSVDRTDIETENGAIESKNGLGVNSQNIDNSNNSRRRGSLTAYPVLRASRRQNSENISNGSTNMDTSPTDSDFRTQFDVLLRNLIGDVNGMNVEPSPLTVSSGYESDYPQTRLLDPVLTEKRRQNGQNKENINNSDNMSVDRSQVGYLTNSDTCEHSSETQRMLKDSTCFTSLPSFPTMHSSESTLERKNENSNVAPSENCVSDIVIRDDKDPHAFSYAQRHNYKLTKVTRSMYEIIHDLQNGEKANANVEGRRKSRKGRRTADGFIGDVINVIKPRGRLHSGIASSENINEIQAFNKVSNKNISSFTGSVVRCVRRPVGGDSSVRPGQRLDSISRQGAPCQDSCDKLQNDLRTLLCDTVDVTASSDFSNDHITSPGHLPVGHSGQEGSSGAVNGRENNGFNQLEVGRDDITVIPESPRLSLNEQFMKRGKPDDHVYETIPGDEKLYEEWKKLRATSKMPRIRRFTTVPDLPGTFVPKEPPALPARKYLNSNQPPVKEHDNYIHMGDINSNFTKAPGEKPDSGYASVASDKMLDTNFMQCYPYPISEENVLSSIGRSDETSDGYCSIDNMTLLRDPLPATSQHDVTTRDWKSVHTNSLPRVPTHRPDIMFDPFLQNRQFRVGFNDSQVNLLTERDRERENANFESLQRGVTFHRSNSTFSSQIFDTEAVRPVIQATYV